MNVTATPMTRDEEGVFFAERFCLSEAEIQAFVDHYNADFAAYDNVVYAHVGSRIAHWWNFWAQDWFGRRMRIPLAWLADRVVREHKRVLLIDVGFSVPYAYTRPDLVDSASFVQLLVDKEASAECFFDSIVDLYRIRRPVKDVVLTANIEVPADKARTLIAARDLAQRYAPDEVVLIASEVIEHLHSPESFWPFVADLQDALAARVTLYATLPVGRKIPSHTLAFLTAADALRYFHEHLRIAWQQVLQPIVASDASPYLTQCVCVRGELASGDAAATP